MQSPVNPWRFNRLSIKNRIIASSALLVLIIALSNLYSYYSNNRVIEQEDQLNGQDLEVLLQLETISQYVALAELESCSYLLIEKEECNKLRRGIWTENIIPAATVLRSKLEENLIQSNKKEMTLLLDNLVIYKKLQEHTERRIRSVLSTTPKTDSIAEYKNKHRMAGEINRDQRLVFDEIKEGTAFLIQQQRTLIKAESKRFLEQMRTTQFLLLVLIAGSLGLAALLSYLLFQSIIIPLQKIGDYVSEVALGKQPTQMEVSKNEMGIIIGSLNRLMTHLVASAEFAGNVGSGKYDNQFTPASENDTLGNALLVMQEKLREAEDGDTKRKWAIEGIAKFSNLLRDQTKDQKVLANELLHFMVSYLKANQGAMFLLQEATDTTQLEMVACYAYDRKKFLNKTIEVGEGLAGQAVREADTIYVTDVPPDYLQITSGLGEALPASILVVPLKVNDKVYGVIELASFEIFAPHEISFMEKLAENAASAISMTQLYGQTRKLLRESTQQSEELKAAEEEMRQNVEELQATQEAETKRAKELERAVSQAEAQKQMMVRNIEKLKKAEKQLREQQAEVEHSMEEETKRVEKVTEVNKQVTNKIIPMLKAAEKELNNK